MIKLFSLLLLLTIYTLGHSASAYANDLPTEHELRGLCQSLADLATHQQLKTIQVQALTDDELDALLTQEQLSIDGKLYKTVYKKEADSLNRLIKSQKESSIALVGVYPLYLNASQKPSLFFQWRFLERGGFSQITSNDQLYTISDITIDTITSTKNDSNTADILVKLNNHYFILNSYEDDPNLLLSASLVTTPQKILPVCSFAAKPPLTRKLTQSKDTLCNDIVENKYLPISPLAKVEIDKLTIKNFNAFYSSQQIYFIDLFDTGNKQYISIGYQWWNSFRGDNAPTIKLLNAQGEFEGIGVGDDMGDLNIAPRREMDTLYKIYLIGYRYYIDTYSQVISYRKGEQESICTFDHISQTPTQLKEVLSIPKTAEGKSKK